MGIDYLVCHRFTQMKHRYPGGRNLFGPICACLPAGRQVCVHLWPTVCLLSDLQPSTARVANRHALGQGSHSNGQTRTRADGQTELTLWLGTRAGGRLSAAGLAGMAAAVAAIAELGPVIGDELL